MRLAPILASILIGLAPCRSQAFSHEWPNSAVRQQLPGQQLPGQHLPGQQRPGHRHRSMESASQGGSNPQPSQPVPEPSTLLLVGTGLVGVALTSRWRRRRPNVDPS